METNERVKQGLMQEAEAMVCQFIEKLQTISEGSLEQVEQMVLQSCLSLGRGWMERVLDEREQGHCPPARREGECGHRQRLVGDRPKRLLTLLGEVQVRRPYYQCLRDGQAEETVIVCSHGQAPWDKVWGVETRRTSPGVQKLVSYLAATMTLEETVEVFERWVPLGMSGRQALNLFQPVGEALAKQEEQDVQKLAQEARCARTQAGTEPAEPAKEIKRLYVELDGIYARHRRSSIVLSNEEQQREGDVYREVKVGAVFAGEPGPERSKLVPGVFVDRAGPIRYVARRATAEAFGPYLYTLAHRCGLAQTEQVIALGDGAVWIWNLIGEYFPQAIQIVDLWHAREHVWKVAHAVFGRTSAKATAWAKQGCDLLTEGAIEKLIQLIEALPPIAPEPGASRSVPDIEADYFRSNAERMRYQTFRAQGMHIGSGIAEAACKTVVSTRAKRSGMRWTPTGLNAILALRTAVLNHEFDLRWGRLVQAA